MRGTSSSYGGIDEADFERLARHGFSDGDERLGLLEAPGTRLVVHEMMFNRVRDGRLATTWAMTAGPGFYVQLTGRQAPEAVDNLG